MKEKEIFDSFKGNAYAIFVFQTRGKDRYNVFAAKTSTAKSNIEGIYNQIRDSFAIPRKRFATSWIGFDKSYLREKLINYRNEKMRKRSRSTGFVVFIFDMDGMVYFTNDIDLGYLHKVEFDKEYLVHAKMKAESKS